MVQKLFWQDPYLTSVTAQITSIEEDVVQLNRTIFYAESGGQESDAGTIGGIQVLSAQKHATKILYQLAETPSFKVGDEVEVVVEWPRRYALMKLHFAAEVVLELFTTLYPKLDKIGAHISQDKSRIDFASDTNIKPLLAEIESKAQAIIDSDSLIKSAFSDEENERRYWQVDGFAKVPCGGTHLKRTSEVGKISLKRKNVGKGKERVEIRVQEEN
ncbi:ser-tRNA(ala) deacylase [Vibrio ishigakensis]|uniref:Ser-tRNA(Ala) deacylase n=1 Tax=Vibrio ishigakensis TaxID=1481914 RepID=A0A0B8QHZ0_9VIBR|nr:ser-tRNA(ala) deacylase [Vibrio ishigakensis]